MINRVMIWVSGQILYASDLNTEFTNITNYINTSFPSNWGTATINFGAFPGATEASLTITGQPLLATSRVLAWVTPIATAEHSMDEHSIENLKISVTAVSSGIGFTILGQCALGSKLYGHWSIGWQWF